MTDDPSSDSIEALIFDAEGVTISTEALWDTVQHEFLAGHGYEYDRAAIKPLVAGRSSIEALQIMQQLFELAGSAAELAAERIEIARRHFTEIEFVDGFPEFFASMRSQFATAMATAMDPTLFALADDRLGLTELFGGHVSTVSDVGGRGKPAPDLFLHAAEAISAPPARSVVFEDAPNGIEAAINAGMHSVGITTTFGAELLTAADLVIDTYADLDVDAILRIPR